MRLRTQITKEKMYLQDTAGVQETWLGGSTNSPRGWMIFDRNGSPLSSQSSWAGGIEESKDSDTNTSRKNTFHAASAFAEGDAVGKATKPGASPFLINMGDPLIARQSGNSTVEGTEYDA